MVTNVGPDPRIWIERLKDVNRGSSFTTRERNIIHAKLVLLQKELGYGTASANSSEASEQTNRSDACGSDKERFKAP